MFKQSIIVPVWLGMSPGKVASQCCHVALRYGRFEDKRVILKVDTHIQLVDILAEAIGWQDPQYPHAPKLEVGHFRDADPTTEGTDGEITAWSIRGPEETVNQVTGKLELY